MEQTRNDKIKNCLVMIAEMKELPARAFVRDLGNWSCGGAACLGGWVAQHPHFVKKGVFAVNQDDIDSRGEFDYYSTGEPYAPGYRDSQRLAEDLFGDSNMFRPQRLSVGPKKEVMLRLEAALDNLLKGNR